MTYPGQKPAWQPPGQPVLEPRTQRRWPWYTLGVAVIVALLAAAALTGIQHAGTAPTTGSTVTAPLTSGDPGSPAAPTGGQR